jgi:hypothetical protein
MCAEGGIVIFRSEEYIGEGGREDVESEKGYASTKYKRKPKKRESTMWLRRRLTERAN